MEDLMISTISTVITACITFFLTRRKYLVEVKKSNIEAKSNELDNIEKAVSIWRELSEELKTHFKADINDLRAENQSMKIQLDKVLKENDGLRQQMSSLEKKLKETTLENTKLTEELKQFNKNYHDHELKLSK